MLNGHRVRRVAGAHLPLRTLTLCLDCEECFEIGADACPRCGSETWIPVARLLERSHDRKAAHSARPKYIAVVSSDKPVVYRQLAQMFAGDETFEVVVDRRRRDRRVEAQLPARERRVADRRVPKPQARLHAFGWIVAKRAAAT